MSNIHKVVGLAGTGKTTYLRDLIVNLVDNNTETREIMFTSFSRSASRAIFEKMKELGYNHKEDLPHFRTIHSLANRVLGLSIEEAPYINSKDKAIFCKSRGLEFSENDGKMPSLDMLDVFGEGVMIDNQLVEGNLILKWFQYLKKALIYEDQIQAAIWHRYKYPEHELKSLENKPPQLLLDIYQEWESYKKKRSRYEYDDMIQELVLSERVYPFTIKFMFIDEAQDLSPLNFKLIQLWQEQCKDVFYAYDLYQTIYFFNAANSSLVELLHGDEIILQSSHRVPKAAWGYAREIAKVIGNDTIEKVASKDEEGVVNHIQYAEVIKKLQEDKNGHDTFLLFRTHRLINLFLDECFQNGFMPIGLGTVHTPSNSPTFCQMWNLLWSLYHNKPLVADDARKILLKFPAEFFNKRGVKEMIRKKKIDDEVLSNDLFSLLQPPYRNIEGLKEIINNARIKIIGKKYLVGMSPKSNKIKNTVFIGTFFASKGLGADKVFLFDYIPNKQANVLRDESRLVFVGVTRTKEELNIVYQPEDDFSNNDSNGLINDFISGEYSRWLDYTGYYNNAMQYQPDVFGSSVVNRILTTRG